MNIVYYLPGWAGHLSTGLGKAHMDRGFDVTGRETGGEFKDFFFTDLVEAGKESLLNYPLFLTIRSSLKTIESYINV
jgi:hypothetical protein